MHRSNEKKQRTRRRIERQEAKEKKKRSRNYKYASAKAGIVEMTGFQFTSFLLKIKRTPYVASDNNDSSLLTCQDCTFNNAQKYVLEHSNEDQI